MKRYRLLVNAGAAVDVVPDANGAWVKWGDHEARVAELEGERECTLAKFLSRALTTNYEPGEIVLAKWDGAALECLTHPDDIRSALNP